MRNLYADLETFSFEPISSGSWKYAESARVLLFAYAVEDDPPEVWDVFHGEPIPQTLAEALADDSVTLVGFNWAMFDDIVLLHAAPHLRKPLALVCDVMVQAGMHGWPMHLDKLCKAAGVPAGIAKQASGRELINLFCKPHKPRKGRATPALFEMGGLTLDEVVAQNPEKWEQFKDYAKHDISATRYMHQRMPRTNYPDNPTVFQAWLRDAEINHRGVALDVEFAKAAARIAAEVGEQANEAISDLTGGAIDSTNQAQLILGMVNAMGVDMPGLRKSDIVEVLASDNIPDSAKELLLLRQESSKTSTAKYSKMLKAVCEDGRLHGLFQFSGAGRTGRWAGRIVQSQNFARPLKSYKKRATQHLVVEAAKAGVLKMIEARPLDALSSTIRCSLTLEQGAVADLSNIEGRTGAWQAGDEAKLQAFRDYDAGTGDDLYKLAYAETFGVPVSAVGDAERSIGKVLELSMQYAGGVGAFVMFSSIYGVDLDAMADTVMDVAPPAIIEEAKGLRDWLGDKVGDMPEHTWLGCDVVKRLWRRANVKTVAFWSALEQAFASALRSPGKPFRAGALVFNATRSGTLAIRLPSGRALFYVGARFEDSKMSYMGMDQFTHRWRRLYTHKGKLFENTVSGMAVDVFTHGMLRACDNGAEIVLHAHDELVAENYPLEQLLDDMSAVPVWAPGLPLSVAGYTDSRYGKG